MKNNRTILIILYVLLSSFLIIECRSGRQTSSKDRRSASQAITPPEKPQPIAPAQKPQPIAQKPATQKPEVKEIASEKKEIVPTQALSRTQPQQKAKTQDNQLLYALFNEKLGSSAHLTEGVIEYTFNNIFDLLTKTKAESDKQPDGKPDKETLQRIKGYFYGLRYPIHKHSREIISAFSDLNAFYCGGIFSSIMKSPESSTKKNVDFTNFKNIGVALKKYKIYQIDNQLENELEKHLKNIETVISVPTINQGEKAIIQNHYIAPLTLLKEYISLPEIKAILPSRESSLYRVYRKTAKNVGSATTTVGRWLASKSIPYISQKLYERYNAAIPAISEDLKIQPTTLNTKMWDAAGKAAGLGWTGVEKGWEGITTVAGDPGLIGTGLMAPIHGLKGLWEKPALILEGIQSIAQYGYRAPGSLWSGFKALAKSATLSALFTTYEITMNNYVMGKDGVSLWLTTALNAIERAITPNTRAITPTDLQADNINVMTMSAAFISDYTTTLCDDIAQRDLDLPRSTAILQSAQIELFRHRRTIISELSNPHAFTYNLLYCMQQWFVEDFTKQIYNSVTSFIEENNLHISEEEADAQADHLITNRIDPTGTGLLEIVEFAEPLAKFFMGPQEDHDFLDKLSRRPSSDPHNKNDCMYLATPITGKRFSLMMSKFDSYLKNIVDELKSFGARSGTQLIQKYWLSVIDQAYGKKLQDHLNTLEAELTALLADANHIIHARNSSGDLYYYTDTDNNNKPIPIAIPAPLVPQSSAQELALIVRNFYINPLRTIAAKLQEEGVLKKLPSGKSWYTKYPVYTVKGGLALGKQVVKTAIDNMTIYDLLAIGGAISATFATGGLAVGTIPAALVAGASAGAATMSFSALALGMLDIDFLNPPPGGDYLTSAYWQALETLIWKGGPTGLQQYTEGKTITATGIVTDIVTKSGPVKKVKEAIREHQRILRSY